MKLALSNIAWPRSADAEVAAIMKETGIAGIEIAPTAIWEEPLKASAAARRELRSWWEGRGIRIVALQALLFGRNALTIFGEEGPRRDTLEYLKGMMDLAAALGAGPMVFGSPRNRLVGKLDRAKASRIAEDFFRAAGELAAERGVALCIEPNPMAYGCDFVTNTDEGVDLVQRVRSTGFGLHLDGGAITLNHESPQASLSAARPWLRHFHASEPNLVPFGTGGTDHSALASALRAIGYEGWVSVEMRASEHALEDVRRAARGVSLQYGDSGSPGRRIPSRG